MNNKKQKLVDVAEKLLHEYMDERFYGHSSKVSKMLELMPDLQDNPNHKEISAKVALLMAEQAREVFNNLKESCFEHCVNGIISLIPIFSDEEINTIYEFINSPEGKKLVRNFDLIRQTFSDGLKPIQIDIIRRWNEPSTISDIDKIIEEVENKGTYLQ